MKLFLTFFSLFLFVAHAEFTSWTSIDGRTAKMELVGVVSKENTLVGAFKLLDGKTINLSEAKLSPEGVNSLKEFFEQQESKKENEPKKPSIYASELDGQLVSLQGRKLKRLTEYKEPSKYYLFYKTASWCPPCQAFTPKLVDFYQKYQSKHPDFFEIILITSDRGEDDMEKYAHDKKMTWPHLNIKKVERFNKKFPFPGNGIPNLILTDLKGTILKASYQNENYIGPQSVMTHLENTLKEEQLTKG